MDIAVSPPDAQRVAMSKFPVLAEGIPFDLTAAAAADFANRCDESLATLGDEPSHVRIELLAVRAIAALKAHHPDGLDRVRVAEEAAEALGTELARAYALAARCLAQPAPEFADARVAAAREILRVADLRAAPTLHPVGYLILLVALLEKGDIRALDRELAEHRRSGRRLGPAHRDPLRWFDCLRSILDGDTELAEEQATAQFTAAQRDGSDALAVYTTQLSVIRWAQGRVDGAEEGFLAARREHPEQLLWPASLAWLWLRQGRRSAAEALLRSLPAVSEIPRDGYWLVTIVVLAEVATLTGARADAEELHRLLLPFADRLVPAGTGVAFWGTAARTLGLLEERLGMLGDARAHLEQAVDVAGRVGAQAWLAEAQIELAEFAIRHDFTDIPAYELLREAKATADARGFAALSARAVHPPRIRVLGRFEVVSRDGAIAEWNSRKARELLKMLVAARGIVTSRDVLMETLWPGVSPGDLGNRFSVAVSAIRRALDPDRVMPRQHYLVVDGDSVRLDPENLDIDLERFHSLASRPDEASQRAADELYSGGPFTDEPYADWAIRAHDDAARMWNALR